MAPEATVESFANGSVISEEDSYYSELEDIVSDEDWVINKEESYSSEEDLEDVKTLSPERYSCLKPEKISQLRDEVISEVSRIISVSRSLACTLLVRSHWSLTLLYDEWYSDEKRVREAVGLLPEQQQESLQQCCCNICFKKFEIKKMVYAPCGVHPFCLDCWKNYLSVAINKDGPGCLKMPCPEPGCKAYVGLDIVDSLGSDCDKEKYYRYLSSSYVEGTWNLAFCPGPNCNFVIRMEKSRPKGYDVTCHNCSYRFCWNCSKETHRPVNCETVENWRKQESCFEADNGRWIMSYTKPCPKCNKNIKKNQGCNQMTCGSPCEYEFCWLCLDRWTFNHSCNKYEDKKKGGEGKYMDGYAHYYERWLSNHKSREIAVANLKFAREEMIETLAYVQKEKQCKLMFIVDALKQIVECRGVLKWSYAHGYYLYLAKPRKMGLFEYMQGVAEAALERLHHCAEKEIDKYINARSSLSDFNDFRVKLTNLMYATQAYFENFVRALDDDFR